MKALSEKPEETSHAHPVWHRHNRSRSCNHHLVMSRPSEKPPPFPWTHSALWPLRAIYRKRTTKISAPFTNGSRGTIDPLAGFLCPGRLPDQGNFLHRD